ncbi:hypothetical protein JXR01_02380 [Candidatus Kaiserbacteria bacterium]|nr:MAG: hypothetical protein JXR01_02380 [Candidatus Kaiserbacteria bacterium]
MANVLPQKERETLRRNYWLRVIVTLTFMLTAAITIGTVSLIPAYLSARTDLNEVIRYQELQSETREVAKKDTALATTRMVNVQIDELLTNKGVSPTRAIEYVMRDWEVHAQDIIITNFTYSMFRAKDAPVELRVSGEAKDRASLNEFVQTLRADSAFYNVSFPVSDLAGGDTIVFSVTLEIEK